MSTLEKLRPRLIAFGVHATLSLVVGLVNLALVFLLWYPGVLAEATGVTRIFLIVVCVDVAIGPLCTLIVYNPKKKSLKFDLAVIAVLQIAALGYGLYTVTLPRPAWIVYNADRFDLVCANDPSPASLAKAPKEYQKAPWTGPKVVGAVLPTDTAARNAILFSAASGGYDLAQMPQYYHPEADVVDSLKSHLQSPEKLKDFNKNPSKAGREALKRYLARSKEVGFVPLRARALDMTVFVDRASGAILEIADLRPWNE